MCLCLFISPIAPCVMSFLVTAASIRREKLKREKLKTEKRKLYSQNVILNYGMEDNPCQINLCGLV